MKYMNNINSGLRTKTALLIAVFVLLTLTGQAANWQVGKKAVAKLLVGCSLMASSPVEVFRVPVVQAKTELPSLEKCFNAVRKELDITEGDSIKRIKKDIGEENWEDLLFFTREYDAGFRGGVLKSAWKQLDGETKQKGIAVSNSFTFDLIALNKAGRIKDKEGATLMVGKVIEDLQNFLDLEKQ